MSLFGITTVTLADRHDPDAFFQTRPGLHVTEDFRRRVVAKAKPSEAGTTHKVESAELMQNLTDKGVEDALPTNHLFDESQVSAVIAGLIAGQPNGEEGALLNNGRANLFYLSFCVVRVHWDADSREWRVFTWRRDENGWLAGVRVFSPAN